jgi:hypothetical protein
MWVEGAKQRADERAAQMDKTAAPDLAADRQQKKQRHTNRGALPAYLPRIHITVAPEHSAAGKIWPSGSTWFWRPRHTGWLGERWGGRTQGGLSADEGDPATAILAAPSNAASVLQ